jgi:hypothetical protein
VLGMEYFFHKTIIKVTHEAHTDGLNHILPHHKSQSYCCAQEQLHVRNQKTPKHGTAYSVNILKHKVQVILITCLKYVQYT